MWAVRVWSFRMVLKSIIPVLIGSLIFHVWFTWRWRTIPPSALLLLLTLREVVQLLNVDVPLAVVVQHWWQLRLRAASTL